MDVLSAVHGYLFALPLIPHPLALLSVLLTAVSAAYAFVPALHRATVLLTRLTWVAFLIPVFSGVILLASGRQVPSNTPLEDGFTRYGCPPDPNRAWEHLMYSGFVLLSLLAIEALLRRGYLDALGISGWRARALVPVVALFMYGCAYMAGRVAILPGTSLIGECR